jgi:hypothetical protein
MRQPFLYSCSLCVCVADNRIGETRILSPHLLSHIRENRKFNELLQMMTYDIYRNKLII